MFPVVKMSDEIKKPLCNSKVKSATSIVSAVLSVSRLVLAGWSDNEKKLTGVYLVSRRLHKSLSAEWLNLLQLMLSRSWVV